ncbi:MAG: hypothetical protein QW038_01750 [Nanopusillaceae archaeon]
MEIQKSFIQNLKKFSEKVKVYYKKDKVLFFGILILFFIVFIILFRSLSKNLTKPLSPLYQIGNITILENTSNRIVLQTREGCLIWIYRDRNVQESLNSIKEEFSIKIKEYSKNNIIVYVGKLPDRQFYKMLMHFLDLEYSCVVLCNHEDIDTSYEEICRTYIA